MDDDIVEHKAIKVGIAEGMEKDADRIAHDEQLIRDANQPLGRFVSEKEQENLNSVTMSLREDVKCSRDIASQLKR